MTSVKKYRIYCSTDSKDEFAWGTSIPTKCPTDTGHTIGDIAVVDKVESNDVKILEEHVPTGGHFQATSFNLNSITAGPSVVTSLNVSYKIPVSGLAFSFVTEASQKGDKIDIIVGKDTIVGSLTADAKIGDTVLNVSQTVIDNIAVGFYVKLDDLSTANDCGIVVDVDTNALTITIDVALTSAFTAADPTYVRMSVYTLKDYYIGTAWRYEVGNSKIGGSYLLPGVTITIEYTNNTADSNKCLYIDSELLY